MCSFIFSGHLRRVRTSRTPPASRRARAFFGITSAQHLRAAAAGARRGRAGAPMGHTGVQRAECGPVRRGAADGGSRLARGGCPGPGGARPGARRGRMMQQGRGQGTWHPNPAAGTGRLRASVSTPGTLASRLLHNNNHNAHTNSHQHLSLAS